MQAAAKRLVAEGRTVDPSAPASRAVDVGRELEQRFRAIVLGGLFPLLDALLRGIVRTSSAAQEVDLEALVLLGLAAYHDSEPRVWRPTPLGRDVHQQLAVLRYEGMRPEPARSDCWQDVLLLRDQRLERGRRLLEWLRLGTPEARCYDCDVAATGLAARHEHAERGWVLACDYHRTVPWQWYRRALDLGLEAVPKLGGLEHDLADLEEVRHG